MSDSTTPTVRASLIVLAACAVLIFVPTHLVDVVYRLWKEHG